MLPQIGFAQTAVQIFYDFDTEQHKFAANDIKTALESAGDTAELINLSNLDNSYTGSKVVIALQSNSVVTTLLSEQGGLEVSDLDEQAYALRTTNSPLSYWVLGGDKNGAMYGGLQIAENIDIKGFSDAFIYNEEESPHLASRGIKFNIPLDERIPTYSNDNDGTSHKVAIKNVWEMDFWETWFDEMARHRYNVLSLWTNNPFSCMTVPPSFPDAIIENIMGFDQNENVVQIKSMSISEKIEFWQDVMEYGYNRGFDIYFFTWNIQPFGTKGSSANIEFGEKGNNADTKRFYYEGMTQFLENYPHLKGFGITVGENMKGLTDSEKEQWAWDTYGKAMYDYAKENSDRELTFIHRQHEGSLSDVKMKFKDLIDIPNVTFDMSFKYSQAHMYSTAEPTYIDGFLGEIGDLNVWLEARNDDYYLLQWADPDFARAYVEGFPSKTVGPLIGADGWVSTRVFASKNLHYENQGTLSIQKTWYQQKIWGRIMYNPNISNTYFKDQLKHKYQVSSSDLFDAWSKASKSIQLANEQVTGSGKDNMDNVSRKLDFQWWPEMSYGHRKYKGVENTRHTSPPKGSNMSAIYETANGNIGDKISAYTTADRIEELANESLEILKGLSGGSSTELALNLEELRAMANLGLHYAHVYRAAIYLEENNDTLAEDNAEKAYCYWQTYINIMDNLFYPVDCHRSLKFSDEDWHVLDEDVLNEYTDLAGENAEPDCTNTLSNNDIHELNKLIVYPNPANDVLHIEVVSDTYSITLINIVGKVMLHKSYLKGKNSINVQQFDTGIYFVKIYSNNNQTIKKVIIK